MKRLLPLIVLAILGCNVSAPLDATLADATVTVDATPLLTVGQRCNSGVATLGMCAAGLSCVACDCPCRSDPSGYCEPPGAAPCRCSDSGCEDMATIPDATATVDATALLTVGQRCDSGIGTLGTCAAGLSCVDCFCPCHRLDPPGYCEPPGVVQPSQCLCTSAGCDMAMIPD